MPVSSNVRPQTNIPSGIKMKLQATLLALLATSHTQAAGTLTAVCKEPVGYAIGFRGELGKFEKVSGPDGMAGGTVPISWPSESETATIVIQGSGGRSIHSGKAVPVFRSPEQVSFVAVYPGAAYLYSLFLKSSTLMISDHGLSLGFESGSAINKSMQAKCGINFS